MNATSQRPAALGRAVDETDSAQPPHLASPHSGYCAAVCFHPHVHCVVTGGGLAPDGKRWIASEQGYLLPVRVLAKLFRGKFLAELNSLYQAGEIKFSGTAVKLNDPREFRRLIKLLYQRRWIVYAKAPFEGAQNVFRYLGRNTHRVAISNSRNQRFDGKRVRFRDKDYADRSRIKSMTLEAEEFVRRFLLHVLPKGLVRIRHYGLLASQNVKTKLAKCFELLPTTHAHCRRPMTTKQTSML